MGERSRNINIDIHSTTLQVYTDSEIGSGDKFWAKFQETADETVRGLSFYFKSPPTLTIGFCPIDEIEISSSKLGTDKNRIWTIVLENLNIKILCNGIEIIDYDLQNAGSEHCRNKWNFGPSQLKFSSEDNASDLYREYATGEQVVKSEFRKQL